MAAQPTISPLPALTIAHQQRIQHLITTLETLGAAQCDIAVLQHLAADMPRFRLGLPAETRHELDELDRSMAAFTNAVESLSEGVDAFRLPDAAHTHLLDIDHLTSVAQQAHDLSQLAAEAALRGKHLADQLSRLNAR